MAKPITAFDSAHLLGDRNTYYTEVKAGHWFCHINARLWPGDRLFESWVWQVVEVKGRLELRADGVAKRVTLTQRAVAGMLLFTPSRRVVLANYLEILSWYRACRWGLEVTDRDDGWVRLEFTRYASRINTRAIGAIPAADLDQPEVVWLHLLDALFSLVHPRRADVLLGSGGHLLTAERERFVREMRRRAVKVAEASSSPA